jgi:hypothetical protein
VPWEAASVALGCAAGLASLAGLGALLFPLRIRFSLEARSAATGTWALAGGASVGPLAVAAVAARGVSPRIAVHVFGRPVLVRPLSWALDRVTQLAARRRAARAEQEQEQEGGERTLSERFDEARAAYGRLAAWVDPVGLAYFLVEEQRRVRLNELLIDPTFNADDAALTGQITAGFYIMSSVLGPKVHITPRPVWWGEGKADCSIKGDVTVYPGLLVFDTVRFLLQHVRPPRAPRAPGGPATAGPAGSGAGGEPR